MTSGARWFRNRALRLQLIASVAGVHMLMMTLLVSVLVRRQQNFLIDRGRNTALMQTDLLAASSAQQLLTSDLPSLAAILASVGRDRTVREAMVTDLRGYVLAHTNSGMLGKYLRDNPSLMVLGGPLEHRLLPNSGPGDIRSASPVLIDGHALGWAWIAADRTGDWEHIGRVARLGAIFTAAAILLGAAFAILLARTIMRPLRLLLAGARRLAVDNLDQPIPVVGENEIGIVARAFNDAMRRLKEQREELERGRAELETRVEQRTEQLTLANQRLMAEIGEREHAEMELKRAHDELEQRVAERTVDLADANLALRQEIAERREIEQALRLKNDDLKDFAYAVSHDLQQPLRSMSGYAQLLERRYRDTLDSDGHDFIGYIAQGSRRMQDLIRDLLAYSRAAASDEIPAESIDCNRCFETAVLNLAIEIETSQAVIECEPLPAVQAHEVAVLQLFQNLLANAIKYRGEEPPKIRVGAASRGREVEFFVADNGIGIDPAHHAIIFRLFRRLQEDESGTGLGLAICSRIVQRYGGRIWVESELGAGSTFRFTLPAADPVE